MKKRVVWLLILMFLCIVTTVTAANSWEELAVHEETSPVLHICEAIVETEEAVQTETETEIPTEVLVGVEAPETESVDILQTTDIDDKELWLPDVVNEYADAYGTIMIVDLTNQHVYCCVDGEVIADADCVSGNSLSSPTPTGLYNVWCKRSDFLMMDKYYTAYATFFNNGIAIHDADTWRSKYGGTIYQGSGSHGCINTPRWFAEIVYNNSTIGTPVYVF